MTNMRSQSLDQQKEWLVPFLWQKARGKGGWRGGVVDRAGSLPGLAGGRSQKLPGHLQILGALGAADLQSPVLHSDWCVGGTSLLPVQAQSSGEGIRSGWGALGPQAFHTHSPPSLPSPEVVQQHVNLRALQGVIPRRATVRSFSDGRCRGSSDNPPVHAPQTIARPRAVCSTVTHGSMSSHFAHMRQERFPVRHIY